VARVLERTGERRRGGSAVSSCRREGVGMGLLEMATSRRQEGRRGDRWGAREGDETARKGTSTAGDPAIYIPFLAGAR
jgi:hypothetical protein